MSTQKTNKRTSRLKNGIDSRIVEDVKEKLKTEENKELIRDAFGNEQKKQRLVQEITKIVSSAEFNETHQNRLNEVKMHNVVSLIVEKLVGLDVLESLRNDPNITDINVIAYDNIWIDHIEQGDIKLDIKFEDEQAYLELLNRFAFASDKTFSYGNPSFDAMFPQIRVNVVGHDLSKSPTLQMRLVSKGLRLSKEFISETNFMSDVGYELLKRTFATHSHLIGGETGSGKTELLRYFARYKKPKKPLIMIEDTPESYLDELYPEEPIKMWKNRETRGNQENEYGYNYHARNAMRHNPTYIYFQESRGGEATEIQKAVATGHIVATTLHSRSCFGSIDRFIDLCQEGKMQTAEVYGKRLTGEDGFRIGVHLKRYGNRKVNEIVEYTGYENGVATGNVLIKYNEMTDSHEVVSPMSKRLWNELISYHKELEGLEELSPYKVVSV